ncbi:ycf20-like protein [Magnolia sinica]|uniref:ycf20-like protein n=1 Tax=Magnolia sinica TaxID=86752 RepID=UPI002657D35F|nr:ycf20-like protein [Magnolia sinica]
MACSMGAIMVQSATPLVENEGSERSYMPLKTCAHMQRWILKPSFSGRISRLGMRSAPIFEKSTFTRHGWSLAFALDTGGIPDNSGQESIDGDNTGLGGTRLGRIVRAGGKQLLEKLNAARRNSPMKIFLVLLGFYTANALATILGQTGDWDVLVAGVVVAAIEGIGMLMYRKPMAMSRGRLQSLVVMVNYWKAGVCLGLFVDAFKLGS